MSVSALKQGSDESVNKYYEIYRKLIALSDLEDDSPFVLLHFKLGLRPKIQDAVLPLAGKSLSDIYQAATAVEKGLASKASYVSAYQRDSNPRNHRPRQNNIFFRDFYTFELLPLPSPLG